MVRVKVISDLVKSGQYKVSFLLFCSVCWACIYNVLPDTGLSESIQKCYAVLEKNYVLLFFEHLYSRP